MKTNLQQLFEIIEVNEPSSADRLQLFWLTWNIKSDLSYLTLDEALNDSLLEVTETSESGNVPTLLVNNKSDKMVFLMAGEQLIGAKQNRVLNASIMVAAQSELVVPVSCVERGRWSYRSRAFYSSGSSSHSFLRKKISEDVYGSYRKGRRAHSKQGEVWTEVDRKLAQMKSFSNSDSLNQVYEDYRKNTEQIIRDIQVPETCCGVVFAFGGKIAGMDIFDKPPTLSKLASKLAKAYLIDALEEKGETVQIESATVREWIGAVSSARFEPFDSSGMGKDVRIESENLIGAGLVLDQGPVHVELFPRIPPKSGSRRKYEENLETDLEVEEELSEELDLDLDLDLELLDEELSEEFEPDLDLNAPSGLNEGTAVHDFVIIPTSRGMVNMVQEAVSSLKEICEQNSISLKMSQELQREEDGGGKSGFLGTLKKLVSLTSDAPRILSHADESQLVALMQNRVPSEGIRMIVTQSGLADHWFVHWHNHEKTSVISLCGWNRISDLPAQALVGSMIVSQSLRFLHPRYDPNRLLHEETRGCLFDFCQNKSDISFKLRTGDICPQCRGGLEALGIQPEPVLRMLDTVRRIAMNL